MKAKVIKPKDFNWKYQQLFSVNQMQEHLKLYRKYVDNVNSYEMDYFFEDGERYNLKMNETFNINGVVLHELFFANIIDNKMFIQTSAIHHKSKLLIIEEYKSHVCWEHDFINCAMIAKGWVIFGYDELTETYKNIILQSHNDGFAVVFKPIIVLDVYEHSYFIDYGADKEKYVKDFLQNINWDIADLRAAK